ncbi:MAG: hypothetical protein IJI03_12390 [Rudaea sp.]|nr:hypothetical protein [Rudaea sp.]
MNWLALLLNRYTLAPAALIGALWYAHHIGYASAEDDADVAMQTHLALDRKADANAQYAAREHEYRLGIAVNTAANAYEKGKTDAKSNAENTVAELRAGTLRLRDRWQGCEAARSALMSQTAAGAGELDAAAADRAESAGRIVQAAAECDAQVAGLQAVLISERAELARPP